MVLMESLYPKTNGDSLVRSSCAVDATIQFPVGWRTIYTHGLVQGRYFLANGIIYRPFTARNGHKSLFWTE